MMFKYRCRVNGQRPVHYEGLNIAFQPNCSIGEGESLVPDGTAHVVLGRKLEGLSDFLPFD